MTNKIGFIGAGKMAQAMIEGLVKSSDFHRENIIASAATESTLQFVQEQYGIQITMDNREVAQFADILILAVKPNLHSELIEEVRESIAKDAIVVTIAAGITLEDLANFFGRKIKTVRTMPNTPSLVGEGMSVLCGNEHVNEEDIAKVDELFQNFGKTEWLEEKLMDAVPAISGSSPAYVYMFIEAMADGGVRQGIPREKALMLAAQAVLGAAKMVVETGEHPSVLKDNVCTPGGATIEAVAALEQHKFRGAVLAAMESCTAKVKQMQNPRGSI